MGEGGDQEKKERKKERKLTEDKKGEKGYTVYTQGRGGEGSFLGLRRKRNPRQELILKDLSNDFLSRTLKIKKQTGTDIISNIT